MMCRSISGSLTRVHLAHSDLRTRRLEPVYPLLWRAGPSAFASVKVCRPEA